jgi:hypothetical protein
VGGSDPGGDRTGGRAAQRLDGIALDGKTLRGSKRAGAPGAHLLAAVSHRLQQTLGQVAVEDKTNEISACPTLLASLLVEGRVVTMDALLTQTAVAQTILDRGGDYVMVVKDNQPTLHEAVATVFTSPPPATNRPGSAAPVTMSATAASKPAR